jgi:hypothetical protein
MAIFNSYVKLPEGIYESTNLPSANQTWQQRIPHQDVNEFRDFPCLKPLTINAGVLRDFTCLLSSLSKPLSAEFQGLDTATCRDTVQHGEKR